MASATIRADLLARIERYRNRYRGDSPKELPVTLDEWSWISAEIYGADGIDAVQFEKIPLCLVEEVYMTADGGIVVRR